MLFSPASLAYTCQDKDCIELSNIVLPIPQGYISTTWGSSCNPKTTFRRQALLNGVPTTASSLNYGNRKKCGFLCDEHELKTYDAHQVITRWKLAEFYSRGDIEAKLWRVTTVPHDNDKKSESDTVGVIYTDNEQVAVFGDDNTWLLWVEQLALIHQ